MKPHTHLFQNDIASSPRLVQLRQHLIIKKNSKYQELGNRNTPEEKDFRRTRRVPFPDEHAQNPENKNLHSVFLQS